MSLDRKTPKNYRKSPLLNKIPESPVEALALLINYVEACAYVAQIPKSDCETMRECPEVLRRQSVDAAKGGRD